MAGPAPKTRDWSARENVHQPEGLHIVVHGLVQVNNTNLDPVLTQGTERIPKNLSLKLSLKRSSEPGLEVLVWKNAVFHREIRADEFDKVIVRWNVERIAECPVIDDREHDQARTGAAAETNAEHRTAPKAKPAKKAAPKKATAKKASAKKAAKKVAKKAGKKVAKKTARKPAKKAAKKSTLKRLVRGLVRRLTPKKAKKKKGGR